MKGKISRKQFIKWGLTGAAGIGLGAVACRPETESQNKGNLSSGKSYRWNMVTAWPPNFPILDEGCKLLSKWIDSLSSGQLKIKVYSGGELIPPLECFDAVSSGTAEMGSAASYYWAGKNSAASIFGALPYGMNAQMMNSWLYSGGGLELWEELYGQYNLVPFPGGNTGVQMGGWFNKPIKSLSDIKGLKMRIPGLGGKVINRLGGTAVLIPGSEIYTNLERGVIDAAEWIGPYHDYKIGFQNIARHYYYPGWHEPSAVLEFFVNKHTFEQLPENLREIIRTATARLNIWMLSAFEYQNAIYSKKIRDEGKVNIQSFPEDVLKAFKEASEIVVDELAASNPMARKILDSYRSFMRDMEYWSGLSEKKLYAIE